mgnify:CR=1 FL=1
MSKAALTLVKAALLVSIQFYPLSCLYIKHKRYLFPIYPFVAGL